MTTAFTASTFFPKPLSRAGKRVKASMQKSFYHAFTTFTDTLQIDAYSNRFHLPPKHITRHPVITRCSHINRLHTFADISQFTFFQQSPEMTIRRSPCHAAYFLKIITKHYVMIGEIFLQPHIYLHLRQRLRRARILTPALTPTNSPRRRASGRKPIVFSSIFDHLFLVLRVTFCVLLKIGAK